MTFEILTPYLKGFHLTLASFLPQRDSEGWKLTTNEWEDYLLQQYAAGKISQTEWETGDPHNYNVETAKPPKDITPLPHLLENLFALHTFFSSNVPPEINVRRGNLKIILYGFGDASGSGFGRSVLEPSGLSCTVGVWGSDREENSSNFREFANIVSTVEEQAARGNLGGSQFFLFTDNSTVESALYNKGNTPSRKLFALVVKLRSLQLQYDCEVIVTHVSGKRMIEQGTDGVSRGCLKLGVTSGLPMLSFIPLHLNAFERHSQLKEWVISWAGNDIEFLNPEDWFERGHDHCGGHYDSLKFWRVALSTSLGLKGPYRFEGSTEAKDTSGYEVALQIVMASRKPGKHSSLYTQWDTIRKLRSSYATFSKTTPQGCRQILALSDERGQINRFVQDGTSSYWFSRFFIGCKRRMGQDWRPNRAFSINLIKEILHSTNERIQHHSTKEERNKWVAFGAYACVTYVLSLRGSEGFLLDLAGLKKHWKVGWPNYFIIPLLGKVKGETDERAHILPCACKTSSDIPVLEFVQRLVHLKINEQGLFEGPAISNENGIVYSTSVIDTCLLEILEDIFDKRRSLFPPTLKDKEELGDMYQSFRSFRRASVSRAAEMGVNQNDIDLVNRWNSKEKAMGNRPGMAMRQHYTQMDLMLQPFIRYTNAM